MLPAKFIVRSGCSSSVNRLWQEITGNHTLMVAYFQEKEYINLRFFILLKTGNTIAASQQKGKYRIE
jgi:hypothetical protein